MFNSLRPKIAHYLDLVLSGIILGLGTSKHGLDANEVFTVYLCMSQKLMDLYPGIYTFDITSRKTNILMKSNYMDFCVIDHAFFEKADLCNVRIVAKK